MSPEVRAIEFSELCLQINVCMIATLQTHLIHAYSEVSSTMLFTVKCISDGVYFQVHNLLSNTASASSLKYC